MAKIRRAADLIRRRKSAPSTKDILSGKIPPHSRAVGSRNGRQYGDMLKDAILQGDISTQDFTLPYRSAKDAKRQEELRQAKSAGLIDAIKRRLTGDRLGGPQLTKNDFDQLAFLDSEAERINLRESWLARRRATVRDKLLGQIGLIRKALLKSEETGISVIQGAQGLLREVIGRLTGDTLKAKLAGFDLLPKDDISTEPSDLPGMRRSTPTQAQQMTGVGSSNVASIGWEPHDQQATIRSDSLGTLFIQFRNGWMYKYVDAPNWLHEALLRAPSKGKAVWALIRRGLYPDGIPYGSASREGYERIR